MAFNLSERIHPLKRAALLLVILAGAGCAQADSLGRYTLTGQVDHVRDGDTIVVAGQPVRLNGIDAPELGDALGRAARQALISIIDGQKLHCVLDGSRTRDRLVGVCQTPDRIDIGRALISQGLALDCARFSRGRYRGDEPPGARQKLTQARYC